MLNTITKLRSAEKRDARVLAELINYAGDGLPAYLWTKIAEPGQDILDIGTSRMLPKIGKEEISVLEQNGTVIAGIQGYPIAKNPEPLSENTPTLFKPLCELENLAPATWYINMVATLPQHRNQGLGGRLLDQADKYATKHNLNAVSLIMTDNNTDAGRLYERMGFKERARLPLHKENWNTEATNWVLMIKQL